MKKSHLSVLIICACLTLVGCVSLPGTDDDTATCGRPGVVINAMIGHSTDQSPQPQTLAYRVQQNQPLDIEDVKALVAEGMSDELLINQINISHSTFHLGTADIIGLKQSGVSDRVIGSMLTTSNSATYAAATTAKLAYDQGLGGMQGIRNVIFYTGFFPGRRWHFSKDNGDSLSEALRLVKLLSRDEFDDVIKTNGNPDFVSFNYCDKEFGYPAMSMIWIKNNQVITLPWRENLTENKVDFWSVENLGSWFKRFNEYSLINEEVPPRLAEAFAQAYKDEIIRLNQEKDMALKNKSDLLKKHLESLKPDLARLKNAADQRRESTFVFKSFYLGMPIEDAALLLDIQMELPPETDVAGMVRIYPDTGLKHIADQGLGVWIEAGADGCVTEILMLRKCVNKIFGCQDAPASFVRKNFEDQLNKAENSRFKSFDYDAKADAYVYMSKRGYRFVVFEGVSIFTEKNLLSAPGFDAHSGGIPDGSISIKKVATMSFE